MQYNLLVPSAEIPLFIMTDRRINMKARYMYFHLYVHHNHDYCNIEILHKEIPGGRTSISKALQILEETGYLTREAKRVGGSFPRIRYHVHEIPLDTTTQQQ